MLVVWEAPRFLIASSQVRRELSMETGRWLPHPKMWAAPLPQEDVTICCAGAFCQRDKIFTAALSGFLFQDTVTYLLQIYMHI